MFEHDINTSTVQVHVRCLTVPEPYLYLSNPPGVQRPCRVMDALSSIYQIEAWPHSSGSAPEEFPLLITSGEKGIPEPEVYAMVIVTGF